MKEHELKCWPEYFRAIKRGVKTFEIRRNDRDFKTGDILILEEWDPDEEEYTGDQITAFVKYAMHNDAVGLTRANDGNGPLSGLEYGYVIMALEIMEKAP